MKLYKIKFEPIHVYPFQFLSDWWFKIKLILDKLKLKRKFKKLNWSEEEMWELTQYCCSLKDAVRTLRDELTKNFRLFPLAEKLIYDGYERDWKRKKRGLKWLILF